MDLSVIIVSYNVKDLLKNCLESVFKFTKDINFEVIVVDNNSTDGSQDFISNFKFQNSNFKFILSQENGGFSKGNNLGIKKAKGKYILLLNPDTLLVENSLKIMFAWMEAHSEVAVASCQLLNSEQKLSPTGGYFPNLFRVAAWAVFFKPFSFHPPAFFYKKEFSPDWVTGAFFMVRKEALEKVGLLDENIFMYGEELEWCMRFKSAGWRIKYTPITKIIHLANSLPRNAVLGEFKGLKYIYEKHFSPWRQTVLEFLLNIAAVLRIIMWSVRLKPAMAKIYLEALFL